MALSKKQATEAARDILNGARQTEKIRLNRIAKALKPASPEDLPTVELPRTVPPPMMALARKARTNYLPLILDVMAQSLIVSGYNVKGSLDFAPQWSQWQANRMDARQTGVHRATLAYGTAYATALPAAGGGFSIRGRSPRKMTALYGDIIDDDWPILALDDGDSNGLYRLIDEELVYYLSADSTGMSRLEFVDSRAHGMGVCPVVRFRDRMLLDEDQQIGIIEPLLTIQQRIDETIFGLMTAQYYAAFKQRYIIGWTAEDEAEQMQTAVSQLWTFEDTDVKVGELNETDPAGYLSSKDSAVGDMSTISQVPKQNLGVGNISNVNAEALAAMEASKDRQAGEWMTSLGESWEQLLGLVSPGDEKAIEAEVRWKDTTARSFAQIVDGLGKMVQMLEVPLEAAWERIPGVTDGDLERWRELAEQQRSNEPDISGIPTGDVDDDTGTAA